MLRVENRCSAPARDPLEPFREITGFADGLAGFPRDDEPLDAVARPWRVEDFVHATGIRHKLVAGVQPQFRRPDLSLDPLPLAGNIS